MADALWFAAGVGIAAAFALQVNAALLLQRWGHYHGGPPHFICERARWLRNTASALLAISVLAALVAAITGAAA